MRDLENIRSFLSQAGSSNYGPHSPLSSPHVALLSSPFLLLRVDLRYLLILSHLTLACLPAQVTEPTVAAPVLPHSGLSHGRGTARSNSEPGATLQQQFREDSGSEVADPEQQRLATGVPAACPSEAHAQAPLPTRPTGMSIESMASRQSSCPLASPSTSCRLDAAGSGAAPSRSMAPLLASRPSDACAPQSPQFHAQPLGDAPVRELEQLQQQEQQEQQQEGDAYVGEQPPPLQQQQQYPPPPQQQQQQPDDFREVSRRTVQLVQASVQRVQQVQQEWWRQQLQQRELQQQQLQQQEHLRRSALQEMRRLIITSAEASVADGEQRKARRRQQRQGLHQRRRQGQQQQEAEAEQQQQVGQQGGLEGQRERLELDGQGGQQRRQQQQISQNGRLNGIKRRVPSSSVGSRGSGGAGGHGGIVLNRKEHRGGAIRADIGGPGAAVPAGVSHGAGVGPPLSNLLLAILAEVNRQAYERSVFARGQQL